LLQRHEVLQNLADTLAKRTIWRAPHGAIAVAIPASELAQLEQLVRAYLAEASTVHDTLSVMFPLEEPYP